MVVPFFLLKPLDDMPGCESVFPSEPCTAAVFSPGKTDSQRVRWKRDNVWWWSGCRVGILGYFLLCSPP